jgi:hypothetical protein
MAANDENHFLGSGLTTGPPSNVLRVLFHEHILDLKMADISFEPELSANRICTADPSQRRSIGQIE